MITFKNIGLNGRIGNTLFTYAALFGIANKLGVDYAIPYENGNAPTKLGYFDFFANKWIYYRFDLADVFYINAKNIPYNYTPKYLYYEKHFSFDKDVFKLKDGTDINGWFQSYRYFAHCDFELRCELKFKEKYLFNAIEHWNKFGFTNKKKLLIAMRLDDGYNFDKNFSTANADFYKKAISLFNLQEYDVVITADNPVKCKQFLVSLISNTKIHVLDEPSPYTTLAFYSLCHDFIIPNSTFAWWGAWFGHLKEKKVVLPAKWFNADVDFSTMHPKNWIKL